MRPFGRRMHHSRSPSESLWECLNWSRQKYLTHESSGEGCYFKAACDCIVYESNLLYYTITTDPILLLPVILNYNGAFVTPIYPRAMQEQVAVLWINFSIRLISFQLVRAIQKALQLCCLLRLSLGPEAATTQWCNSFQETLSQLSC
jgi:hypothetical protein